MLYTIKLFLLSCCILGIPAYPDDFNKRIIRGQIVAAKNYPYYIFLKLGSRVCGGALIGVQTVLTAARCLDKVPIGSITAYTGFNKIDEKDHSYTADWFIIHPKYPEHPSYNLAVIKLNENVLRKDVEIIQKAQTPPKIGSEVGIVGYGAFRCNPGKPNCNQTSNRLRFTKTTVKEYWNPYMVAENSGGKSVCTGDAGGPVFFNGTLVAIISHSQPDCTGLNYFVRVDSQSKNLRWFFLNTGLADAGLGGSRAAFPNPAPTVWISDQDSDSSVEEETGDQTE